MTANRHISRLFCAVLAAAGLLPVANAADGGASVYPAGVETIMPGMMPPPGQSILLVFNNFYQANAVMDGAGRSAVPGFHLRVAAVAVRIIHNWGVNALGGLLVSSIAVPILYEHVDGPFGKFDKTGIGNVGIGVLAVSYAKRDWHWWYGIDGFTPGGEYNKNDILNVGQHNFAAAPSGAFTYLPRRGTIELSSKLQYIVNFTNPATRYRSGHEFVWEYAAMHSLTKHASIGLNGYYSQQTTSDLQYGIPVPGGDRERVLAAGPQLKYRLRAVELILKYQKESMVENRTKGNSFWCQIGIPLWRHED
jgi:hypothetical protein